MDLLDRVFPPDQCDAPPAFLDAAFMEATYNPEVLTRLGQMEMECSREVMGND